MPEPDLSASAAFLAAVGENVLTHRETLGLTQAQLAANVGVSVGYLSRIERGRADPRLVTMDRLARALGASVGELLDVEGSELGIIARNVGDDVKGPRRE